MRLKQTLQFISRLVNLARSEWDLTLLESEICGQGTRFGRGCQILGEKAIRIGSNCVIGEYSWFNINSGDPLKSHISIGDDSLIGRRNFLSAGDSIELGPYTLTGPDCRLIGADHAIADVTLPFISAGSRLKGSIRLGANCWLGANVTIIGNVDIGYGSVVGAGSIVLKDIPPFSLAVGGPAKVVKRFDFSKNDWVGLEYWSDDAESRLPSEEEYLKTLRGRGRTYIPKIAAGAGVDRPD